MCDIVVIIFNLNLKMDSLDHYIILQNYLTKDYIYVILASPLPSPMRSPARTPMTQQRPSGPHCTAIYDFDPENPGELGFKVIICFFNFL